MSPLAQPEDRVLSRAELADELDREARALLGISGDEFRDRLARDELPEHPAVAHLALMAGAGAC